MACFIVPTAEAVVTTLIQKSFDKKAKKKKVEIRNPFLKRMNWLNTMLWGGSALLAFEHIWHGEITPWFPFLTNAANPADAAVMLREMATSGVAMAVLVTAVWAGIAMVAGAIEKKQLTDRIAISGGKQS